MKRITILVAALAISAIVPAMALASAPGATTTAATDVTASTATLNGVVNPNKEETTYFFEFGTTAGYGAKTAVQPAESGNAGKAVAVAIGGLSPGTTYHFRLVATNPSGTDQGGDLTFTTAGVPYALPGGGQNGANTVTLTATPTITTFGRSVVLAGQVTGNNNTGVRVELQQNPYPFGGFKATNLAVNTDAAGKFSFTVKPAALIRYLVIAKASPPVASPAVQVRVRYSVAFKVNDATARRGQLIRFSGVVKPAHNGRTARIQRRTSAGKWRTIATTRLRASTAGQSTYARSLRVRSTATYRVRIGADADHLTGTSRTRRVRVS
jgi:hypothetical protein